MNGKHVFGLVLSCLKAVGSAGAMMKAQNLRMMNGNDTGMNWNNTKLKDGTTVA